MTQGAIENKAMFPIVIDEVMRYEPRFAGAIFLPVLELYDKAAIYKLLNLRFVYFSLDWIIK